MKNQKLIYVIRNVIVIFVSMFLLGLMGMLLAYALPTERINKNLIKSIQMYEDEGTWPEWADGYTTTEMDNYTDMLMLQICEYNGNENLLNKSMLNPRNYYEGKEYVETLKEQLKETEPDEVSYYARYWHGYVVVLKPLLLLFDVPTIRLINTIIQFVLMAYVLIMLYDKLGMNIAFSFVMALLVLNPITISLSFLFSICYYVMMIFVLIILKKNDWLKINNRYLYAFLICGCAVAYFDFLTYPMTTLGIPLVLAVLMNWNGFACGKLSDGVKKVVGMTLMWMFGYFGMWASKWVVASIVTGQNIVLNGLSAAGSRLSREVGWLEVNSLNSILKQIQPLVNTPYILLFVIATVICVVKCIKCQKQVNKSNKNLFIIMGIVILEPIIWYVVLRNHSIVHSWFTYRSLSVCVFGILGSVAKIFLNREDNSV